MSVQVENLDGNMAKLTVELEPEKLSDAILKVYNRQKNSISLPGFRKGKVPLVMVEQMYGKDVFYDDAASLLIQEHYPDAYDESGLDIVSAPEIEVVQVQRGEPFIFTAVVATKPPVVLGSYKGIEVPRQEIAVSDEEVEERIEQERRKNGREVEVTGPAEEGDTLNIDFTGYVDGETFEGGSGEDYQLRLGSHSFIDTFEDQLVGSNAGDDVEVNVTFPEDYGAAELAGKPALFKVHVNSMTTQELPELDDEFAQDVSEFDTLDEYRFDVRSRMEESRKRAAKQAQSQVAVEKLAEDCEIDIPEPMIDAQADNMFREFSSQLSQQGMSVDQYLQYTGQTRAQLLDQMRPDAVARIRQSLALEALAEEAAIEVTDEDFEEELRRMADSYRMELDQIREVFGDEQKENIKRDLRIQKAVDLLLENAVEVDPVEEEEDEAEEEEILDLTAEAPED